MVPFGRSRCLILPALIGVFAACTATSAKAQAESTVPACYATGGGALEICRSEGEPEGVFYAPPACRFAYDVQILRLKARSAPGPLQVVHHAEPSRGASRGRDAPDCETDLRATDATIGGSVRTGRVSEQLAEAMPPTDYRFWAMQPRQEARQQTRREARSEARRQAREERRSQRRDRRRGREAGETRREEIRAAALVAREGSAGRDPMTVAGRDWAGDEYHYLFMIASEAIGEKRRNVLIQGRTIDFERIEVRGRVEDSDTVDWVPFGEQETEEPPQRRRGRRGRGRAPTSPAPPALAPVLDEAGNPITGSCAAEGFDARGLVGSISVVDQTYHYFYADVLPADCDAPPAKRRMGLYLRTSKDVTAGKAWSGATTVVEGLPPDTLVRVGKAKAMERWVLAYSCFRPANAPGGPVADICLHYTADLSVEAIKALPLFFEPASAARSGAYLGLRSGGDGSGRYGRDGFFWMTDRYGNLATPASYPTKGGFLTWLDRYAPRADGSEGSTLYGRPVYWSTWTVRGR